MPGTYTVAVASMGGDDAAPVIEFLASAEQVTLSRPEITDRVENGGTVLRTDDERAVRTVRDSIEEYGGDATVDWVGPNGERQPVEALYRVKGTVTGGAPPEEATVSVRNADGPTLASEGVLSDGSYDVTYPRLEEEEEFELVVALRNATGEKITAAPPVVGPEPVEVVDLELTFGNAAPVTEGDDLLDFMLVKPTAAAAAETDSTVTTESAMETTVYDELLAAKEASDRDAMASVAAEFVDSERFVSDLEELNSPLSAFRTAAESANSLADLEEAVEGTFDAPVEDVVDSGAFHEDREQVETSLTAATLDRTDHESTVGRLSDAVRLFSLVDRIAAGDESLDTHGAVGRALDRSVTLPTELFPLPRTGIWQAGDERGTNGDSAAALAQELQEIRFARAEMAETVLPGATAVAATAESNAEPPDGFGDAIGDHPESDDGSEGEMDGEGDSDDAAGDDVARDGGSGMVTPGDVLEALSESTAGILESIGATDAADRPMETLATLGERERSIGEELQYELLDGGDETGPHSPVTLLGDSIGRTPRPDSGDATVPMDGELAYPSEPHVHPLGVAELQTMRKSLDRYQMGEIAHVENVLEGERRKRTHRTLERSEEYVSTETERVKEKKQSLETTERFEMETETSETVEQERVIDTGVQVTASYGPSVEMKAHANYDQRTAKTETRTSSQQFAREITEKTVNRIKRRVKRKEWEKEIEETEETNVHEIDNSGPNDDDHVIGIYRWLDKYYDAQVFNHGKRMLLEFIVPEPAAFYRYAQATDAAEEVDMERPIPPEINEGTLEVMDEPENPDPNDPGGLVEQLDEGKLRALRPTDLHEWNYTYYAQRYGAEVSPPPRKYKLKAKTLNQESSKPKVLFKSYTVSIPEGYVATEATLADPQGVRPDIEPNEPGERLSGLVIDVAGWDENQGIIGDTWAGELGLIDEQDPEWGDIGYMLSRVAGSSPWTEQVPVSVYAERSLGYSVQVHVLCTRTEENYDQWQLDTYRSIMQAYQEQRSEYEERVAAQRVQDGVDISGRNPKRNREIEQTELKRLMMAMVADDTLHPGAIEEETGPSTSPTDVDMEGIKSEADTIRFLEQAFEWPNMTYRFYPYFWADPEKWSALSRLESTDPTFASFLRAGAARVVLPVRPGYEHHVPYYMIKGEPYSDEGRPTIGDPTYRPIIDAIKENQNKLPEDATPVGDPWKVEVPTSLVKLQEGGSLDSGGS